MKKKYFYIQRKYIKTILKTVNDSLYIVNSLTEILILFVEILKFGTAPRVLENQILDLQRNCRRHVQMLMATSHYSMYSVLMFVSKMPGHTVRTLSADYPLVLLSLIGDKRLVTIRDIKKK